MAPYRALQINLASANDLREVNFLSKMDVYVVASLSRDGYWFDQGSIINSTVHRNGGCNPTWNFRLTIIVDEALARQDRLNLRLDIKAEGFRRDKDVGSVNIKVKDLLDSAADGDGESIVRFQVFRPFSGRPKGTLCLSYKFGEEIKVGSGSVHQGPAPPPGSGWGFPPPPPPPYQGQQAGYPSSSCMSGLSQMLERVRFWFGIGDLAYNASQYAPLNVPMPFDMGADAGNF